MATNNRPLTTYSIPPSIQTKLNKAGLLTAANVLCFRPSELSSNAQITIEEAADVLDIVKTPNTALLNSKTALQLLQAELSHWKITSFCKEIDLVLGGGVSVGKLLEISGIAGVGKTQLCLQLCITVQMPKEYGGTQGQAIYIDTEGSFNVSRIEDIGEACIRHCNNAMGLPDNAWTFKSIIDNIFVFRCREITELLSCVMILKEFLKTHDQVRLIVIDSIAFHFRHDLENAALRSRALHKVAAQLTNLAVQFQTAVVVTNQMTTKFDSSNRGYSTPALGTSWGHAPTFRLLLDWDPSHCFRWATLIKSSSLPSGSVPYQVVKDGVRDIVTNKKIDVRPIVIIQDGIAGTYFDPVQV